MIQVPNLGRFESLGDAMEVWRKIDGMKGQISDAKCAFGICTSRLLIAASMLEMTGDKNAAISKLREIAGDLRNWSQLLGEQTDG